MIAATDHLDSESASSELLPSRLGGELPLFVERFGARSHWDERWLAFSHGRAALRWIMERKAIRSAVYCAYTCPTVPEFFARRALPTATFDVAATADAIAASALALPAPRLVLVPSLFGAALWLDAAVLKSLLDLADIVVIDAAQTAFGHIDFVPPPGGAVLSCPRKTTTLADGAVLALDEAAGQSIAALPTASRAAALKLVARSLWATGRPALEGQGVSFNIESERSWPDEPCRMTDESRVMFERLDAGWHRDQRRANRTTLGRRLAGRVPFWSVDQGTPFSLPIFVKNRAALLAHLHQARIFASPLWPDAKFDPGRHPVAAWFASHLVSLPVDQRNDEADMERVAASVLEQAEPPEQPVPAQARGLVSNRLSAPAG